jgi:hypothetical protein
LNEDPPLLYGDLKVDGVGNPIPKGIVKPNAGTNTGFGYDFFTSDGYLVELSISTLTNLLIGDGVFFFHGTATVDELSQNLPFNLAFTSPTVFFTYSASYVVVPTGGPGTPILSALGTGSFHITGEGHLIPEPAVTMLAGSGLVVGILALHRRRRFSS